MRRCQAASKQAAAAAGATGGKRLPLGFCSPLQTSCEPAKGHLAGLCSHQDAWFPPREARLGRIWPRLAQAQTQTKHRPNLQKSCTAASVPCQRGGDSGASARLSKSVHVPLTLRPAGLAVHQFHLARQWAGCTLASVGYVKATLAGARGVGSVENGRGGRGWVSGLGTGQTGSLPAERPVSARHFCG